MPIEVVLPKVDMDMESGVINVWKVAEGDFVREGDILFEMETNKSVMDVEAPGSGTVRGLATITGDPVAVGTPVAWIDNEAEAGREAETVADPAIAPARPAAAPITAEVADTAANATAASADAGETLAPNPNDADLRATPLARRAARLRNVDLARVTGSGPHGRIIERDVEAHAAACETRDSQRVTPGQTDGGHPARKDAGAGADEGGRLVPFNPVRRIVAQRLGESKRNAPHFYLTAQVEMTALLQALHALTPPITKATGVKASVTLLLARLVSRVLMDHPLVNASIEGDAARLHTSAHIGIAMDWEGDLLVPVLRDVQSRPLIELAREFGRLRDAVRSRSIAPADMRGGTFTISNLGMYGVDAFTAIINQPESAILAIGRTADTPVGRDGQIVLRPMATLSLSSDHRIVDGITAARFMADLRRAIEDPADLLRDESD